MLSRAIVERETSDLAGVILGRDDFDISSTENCVGLGLIVSVHCGGKSIAMPLSSFDLSLNLDDMSEKILIPRILVLKNSLAS